MAKVKVKFPFIGSPEEVEKYGGQVPPDMAKLEHRMTSGQRASYNGKINAGTEMEVSDARAKELLELGLIEGDQQKAKEKAEKKGAQVLTTEKVKKAGETKKAETKGIPTAKK